MRSSSKTIVLLLILLLTSTILRGQEPADFEFPTANYEHLVTQDFGIPNPLYGNKLHAGQDILAAPLAMEVVAARSGRVMLARPWKKCPNWGYILVIEHILDDGSRVSSIYGHLDSNTVAVVEGQMISRGSFLGRTGNYSCWNEHLHFGIHIGSYAAPVGIYPTWLTGYLTQEAFPASYVKPTDFIKGRPFWIRITPAGSGPKQAGGSQSTAYDVATDTLIVFGGSDPLTPCCVASNDTWVLRNATGVAGTPTWEKLIPDAPEGLPDGRGAHSAVYDPGTNRMIIFGGGQSNGFHFDPLFNDVWVLTHANGLGGDPEWVPRSPTGGPPAPREGHGAFYKQSTNEMFVFGGGDNGIMSVPNDLWVLQNANSIDTQLSWTLLAQTGNVPGRIQHFATAYDPVSNRMTIAGGCCFYTNASRVLDFNAPGGTPQWTTLSPGGILPPIGDALLYGYDRFSNRLIVHGISPGSGTNATWLFSNANAVGATPMWVNSIPRGTSGSPTEGLILTGSAYNAANKKFILALNRIDALGNLVPEVWVLSNADQQ